MSGNSAIQGSIGKNAAKYALSPLTQVSQRYGWPTGLSTAAGASDLRPPGSVAAQLFEGLKIERRPWEPPRFFTPAPWLPES